MKWISVEDRLPSDFGWFLVCDDYIAAKDKVTMGFYEGEESGCWLPLDSREYPDSMVVTHWMPLPSPPEVN